MASYFSSKKSIPHSPSAPSISYKAIVADNLDFDDLNFDSDPHLSIQNGVTQSPPSPKTVGNFESYDDIRSGTGKSSDGILTVQNRSLSCNVTSSEKQGSSSSGPASPILKNNEMQVKAEDKALNKNKKPPKLDFSGQYVENELEGISKSVDNRKILLFVFTISVLLISLPVPSFLSGFIVGVFITASCAFVLFTAMFPFLNHKTVLKQKASTESPKCSDTSHDAILRHQVSQPCVLKMPS